MNFCSFSMMSPQNVRKTSVSFALARLALDTRARASTESFLTSWLRAAISLLAMEPAERSFLIIKILLTGIVLEHLRAHFCRRKLPKTTRRAISSFNGERGPKHQRLAVFHHLYPLPLARRKAHCLWRSHRRQGDR